MPRMAEFCAVLHQVLMGLLYHRKLKKLYKRTDMSVLAVKINLCNTLFPYGGDYMDKDNERILLANVIGECIKSLQLDKNINQKELALLSGVSERSLRRIERGQVNVNVYVLRQLVMALGEEMPDFWRIVEKNMELMGEEFPHVRKRVADKVLRDNKK